MPAEIEKARPADAYEPRPQTASQSLPTFTANAVPRSVVSDASTRSGSNNHDDDSDRIESMIIMEVGCGTGSSLFSLASLRPDCRLVGCDLSSHAVELVKVGDACIARVDYRAISSLV